MKKWQIIAPIGIAAAAAAAVLAMRKKPQAAADAKPAPAAKKPAPAAQLKTGSYSFVSGYKDAATVEVKVGYDPERFSFAVIEDSFPAYSSDSHVAVIYGEDFTAQIEYAGYYHGEDFAAMSAAARGKSAQPAAGQHRLDVRVAQRRGREETGRVRGHESMAAMIDSRACSATWRRPSSPGVIGACAVLVT